jgi:hypothetical protein
MEADAEKIEPGPGMMQSIEEHQEIPKGEATVMTIGGLRKQHRVWNQAAEHRQKQEERTQGYYGSRKRVNVAGRRMTRCTGVAWDRKIVEY